MRDLGIAVQDRIDDADHARVPLSLKQDIVRSAMLHGGIGCLPLLGRGLHHLRHEPTHQALAAARDAHDLFQRWQRLERYIHSRHRCLIDSCSMDEAWIHHVTLGAGPVPSAAEDLVVAGVLAALLEAIGLSDVQLWIDGVMAFPDAQAQELAQATERGATSRWRFCWNSSKSRVRSTGAATLAFEFGADVLWPEWVRSAYLQLVTDLTRPLTLPELALELGLPVRTLQRRLSETGMSYSRLLAEARCRTGAWRLLHTLDPIAEVGFLSGFSDQSHFTREMQRRVGMPPAAYREAFGISRPLTV